MSVIVVLLEFVRWEIGDKKGPKNEGLVRSLHAFSGRVRSTQSLSGGWAAHSCFGARICDDVHHGLVPIMGPSHPLIKSTSRNTRASSEAVGRGLLRVNHVTLTVGRPLPIYP